jgi:hypothetical protein
MNCQAISQLYRHVCKVEESALILHATQHHNHVELDQLKPLREVVIKILLDLSLSHKCRIGWQSCGGDIASWHEFALSI